MTIHILINEKWFFAYFSFLLTALKTQLGKIYLCTHKNLCFSLQFSDMAYLSVQTTKISMQHFD